MTSPLCRATPLISTSTWSGSLLDFRPGFVGIVFFHALGHCSGIWPYIFLKDFAVVIDDKCHRAGIAVLCRIGNHSKAADQFASPHVVVSAARGVLSLGCQQFIVIAMVRNRGRRQFSLVSFAPCPSHGRT